MRGKMIFPIPKKADTALLLFLLLTAVFSASGCASWFNVKNLATDSLEDGFSSVVLARVKIIDKTNLLTNSHVQLHFLSKKDSEQRFDWIYSANKEENVRWIKRDSYSTYETLLVGQARPSDYQIVNCHIFQGSYAVNANMETKPLRFSLKPGEILHLGTLEVVINAITFEGRRIRYNYSYSTYTDATVQSSDIQLFRALYPQLAQRFNNTFNAVSWK